MHPILLRILLFVLAVWLIKRILTALMGTFRRTDSRVNAQNPTKNMVKDPVCGMYMDSRLAIRLENRKGIFYFCSEDCRKKFLEAPPSDK